MGRMCEFWRSVFGSFDANVYRGSFAPAGSGPVTVGSGFVFRLLLLL